MQNLLYAMAVVLVILWALGFFVYNTGSIIHILLVIAVIAILLRIIKGKERIYRTLTSNFKIKYHENNS